MFYFKQSLFRTVIFIAWFRENYTYGGENLQFIYACAFWCSVILTLLTYDYDYWTHVGMFSPPAWPIVGHIWKLAAFKEHSGYFFKNVYDTYKSKRFIGIHQFYRRTVVVCEPELVRRMCVHDFQQFTDRGFSFDRALDPLAESVLYLRGNQWKALRSKISPIFSPIKLKGMLPLVDDTAIEFVSRVKKLINETKTDIDEDKMADWSKRNGESIQIKENGGDIVKTDIDKQNGGNVKKDGGKIVSCSQLFGGYTADAIVPCAFGVKSHVMENPEDPFAVALRAYYEFTFRNVLEKSLHYFWPAFAMFMKIRIIPRKTHEFFYNIVTNVLRERQNGVHERRGDFIDMMMALQSDESNHNLDKDDVHISDMVISANAFIIFLGGFETTSSTLSFLFLELAEHHDVQEKMRGEIREVLERHGGVISYETLQDLTYMEMVIQETLRLYPPFPAIQRQCRRAYTLPRAPADAPADERARTHADAVIEPDTLVIFPTLGLQRDEQYFENATSFIPERWAEGQPPPPPGVYMPFGDGPRYCIGKRFAMIQMKCCLVKLLQHVKISPAPKIETNSTNKSSPLRGSAESCGQSDSRNGSCGSYTGHGSKRREPFAADVRCPMTLHPADSRVTLTLL